jgi:hypothetical protein
VNWEIGIGIIPSKAKGRRGRDRMVVGFSTKGNNPNLGSLVWFYGA